MEIVVTLLIYLVFVFVVMLVWDGVKDLYKWIKRIHYEHKLKKRGRG